MGCKMSFDSEDLRWLAMQTDVYIWSYPIHGFHGILKAACCNHSLDLTYTIVYPQSSQHHDLLYVTSLSRIEVSSQVDGRKLVLWVGKLISALLMNKLRGWWRENQWLNILLAVPHWMLLWRSNFSGGLMAQLTWSNSKYSIQWVEHQIYVKMWVIWIHRNNEYTFMANMCTAVMTFSISPKIQLLKSVGSNLNICDSGDGGHDSMTMRLTTCARHGRQWWVGLNVYMWH